MPGASEREPSPVPWPLVGRDAELATLTATFAGAPGGCVVRGEPGVGKTRLLREAAARWSAGGGGVEWSSGTSTARAIAFGAVAHLVRPGGRASNLHELLHEALAALEQRAETQRLALVVDDAHLLDGASAALLHLVATRSRLCVLVGVRTGEPAPDAVVALWKDGILDRLDLAPLDEERTLELLAAVVPTGLSTGTAARLWELSRGNPLFLHELVAIATDPAGPQRLEEPLVVSGDSGSAVRLRELVEARMGLLDPPLFDALEVVAVGEPVPAPLVERLVAPESIEELERRNLVHVSGGFEARTAHPLYGEALRAGMGMLRRRSVLRRLAEATETSDSVDRVRVAVWKLEAGDRDPELFTSAARDALGLLDHTLAERLARAVLLGTGSEDQVAGLVLGEALVGQGRAAEAEAVLGHLAARDEETRARVAMLRGANLYRGLGRRDEGLAVIEAAEAGLGDPRWQAECQSLRSTLLLQSRRDDEALALAGALLDDEHAREPARLRAMVTATGLWMHRGATDRVLEVTADAIPKARIWRHEVPLVDVEFALVLVRFWALVLAGRFDEARRFAEQGFSHPHPPRALRAALAYMRGAAALNEGRATDAVEAFAEAAEGLEHNDWFGLRRYVRSYRVCAFVFAGDLDAARGLVGTEVTNVAGPDTEDAVPFDVAVSLAWFDAGEGRVSAAVDRLLDAATRARESSGAIALTAYHDVARLGRPELVLDALADLAARVEGPLAPACLAHARAQAGGDAAGLVASARSFEDLGALLLAAEAEARAAAAFAAAGRHGTALGSKERSASLLDRCGNPCSPVFDLVPGDEAEPLTRREREIALLAAQGLSSAALAAELHVSVHTVHTHLTRIYRKLGVAGREELGRQLTAGPPPPADQPRPARR